MGKYHVEEIRNRDSDDGWKRWDDLYRFFDDMITQYIAVQQRLAEHMGKLNDAHTMIEDDIERLKAEIIVGKEIAGAHKGKVLLEKHNAQR